MDRIGHNRNIRYARHLFDQLFEKKQNGDYVGDGDIRICIEKMPEFGLSEIRVFSEQIQKSGSRTKQFYCKVQLRHDGREKSVSLVIIGSKNYKDNKIEELQRKVGDDSNLLLNFSKSHARRIIRAIAETFGKNGNSRQKAESPVL